LEPSDDFSIRKQTGALAEAIVELQYTRQPEIWKPYGSPGRSKSVRDAGYHLDYLAEAVEADAPELFTAYLEWVKVLFSGLHFPGSVLASTLDCTRVVLGERLPEEIREQTLKMLAAGMHSLEEMPVTIPSFIGSNLPQHELARDYIEALLSGQRKSASRMVVQSVEQGTPVKDIYLQVFLPAQYEIGRLWQVNQISVAQEHYCTAATQMIMSQLYPRIFETEKKGGRRLVATCVGGELHEIGARMVADFFEMDGWDTYFLGANMPTESILRMAAQQHANLLAISATMTYHVEEVRELIRETRRSGLKLQILVGGYPFNRAPDLWKKVGADGYAADAQKAIQVAENWIAGR
jgi:methanogenic corrinoid protein MtbC1